MLGKEAGEASALSQAEILLGSALGYLSHQQLAVLLFSVITERKILPENPRATGLLGTYRPRTETEMPK